MVLQHREGRPHASARVRCAGERSDALTATPGEEQRIDVLDVTSEKTRVGELYQA